MKILFLITILISSIFANPPRTLSADRMPIKLDGDDYTTVIVVMCIEQTKWVLRYKDGVPPIQMMVKSKDSLTGDTIVVPAECK